MVNVYRDRIKETSATVGTGTLTLSGAVAKFNAFFKTGTLEVGATFPYLIEHPTLAEWEVGLGTLLTSTTMERTTVLDSSNAGSLVTFTAGNKVVSLTVAAAQITEALRALVAADIPSLDASKIASGVLNIARIPTIPTTQISGVLPLNQVGAISFTDISGTLNAAVIAAGTFANGRINFAAPDPIGSSTPNTGAFTTLSASGDVTLSGAPGRIKPAANSTTALQITNAAGTAIVTVDTTNSRLGIGATPAATFHISSTNPGFLLEDTAQAAATKYFDAIYSSQRLRFRGLDASLVATEVMSISRNGLIGIGTSGLVGTRLHVNDTTAGAATVVNVLSITRNISGASSAGFGLGIQLYLRSSTTDNRLSANIKTAWNDPTDAAAIGDLYLNGVYNAAGTVTEREGIRIRGGSAATQIGFFGTTPAAKPTVTGSRGANAALASLLTALSTLGLLIDSSSA